MPVPCGRPRVHKCWERRIRLAGLRRPHPPRRLPGYAAAAQEVHDALLRYGRVPAWCTGCYGGTTRFTGHLKEYLAVPFVHWLGPVTGVQALFVVPKVLAALALYTLALRLFGVPAAAMAAGYVLESSISVVTERRRLVDGARAESAL